MDPNETLRLYVVAVASGRADEAAEHHDNLVEWIRKGGFEPDWGTHTTIRDVVMQAVRRRQAKSPEFSRFMVVAPGPAPATRTFTVRCIETIALTTEITIPEDEANAPDFDYDNIIRLAQIKDGGWEEESLGTDDFEVYDEHNQELLYPLEDNNG